MSHPIEEQKDKTFVLQVTVIQSGKDLNKAILTLATDLGTIIPSEDFQISNVGAEVPDNTWLSYIPNEEKPEIRGGIMQITANIQIWDRELDIIKAIVDKIKPSLYTVIFHADGSVTIGAWNATWSDNENEFAEQLPGLVTIRKIQRQVGSNQTYGTITYEGVSND